MGASCCHSCRVKPTATSPNDGDPCSSTALVNVASAAPSATAEAGRKLTSPPRGSGFPDVRPQKTLSILPTLSCTLWERERKYQGRSRCWISIHPGSKQASTEDAGAGAEGSAAPIYGCVSLTERGEQCGMAATSHVLASRLSVTGSHVRARRTAFRRQRVFT